MREPNGNDTIIHLLKIKSYATNTKNKADAPVMDGTAQPQKCSRSKALLTAWAIFQNEDVTLHYLTRRFSHEHYRNKTNPNALTLFGN